MRDAVALVTIAAAMFVALGANRALEQQRVLDAARPISGRVLSSTVREFTTTDGKNRRTTTYRPDVHYHFTPDGGDIYSNHQVLPVNPDTSRRRAEQIVADYPPGNY